MWDGGSRAFYAESRVLMLRGPRRGTSLRTAGACVYVQSALRISHQSVFKSNHMMCRRGPLALHCQVLFPLLLFSQCPRQWYSAVKPDLPCVTEKQIQCLQRLQLIAWGWFHVSLSLSCCCHSGSLKNKSGTWLWFSAINRSVVASNTAEWPLC